MLFTQKKTFYWTFYLKNVVKQKRCRRAILLGAKKKPKKNKKKIKGVAVATGAFISKKKLKSHFLDPKKHFLNFIFREVILHAVSTNCKLRPLNKFLYTLMHFHLAIQYNSEDFALTYNSYWIWLIKIAILISMAFMISINIIINYTMYAFWYKIIHDIIPNCFFSKIDNEKKKKSRLICVILCLILP